MKTALIIEEIGVKSNCTALAEQGIEVHIVGVKQAKKQKPKSKK
jgi:hypothetical protein